MAQNGLFRIAMRGFHKQDVLQYIDDVTAAWNEERVQLEQQTQAAVQEQEQAAAAAKQADAQSAEAQRRAQVAETQLAETQEQVYRAAAELAESQAALADLTAQLEQARCRIAQLEQQVADTAAERDEAIAAVADARQQAAECDRMRGQLQDRHQHIQRQSEQLAALQKKVDRYEKVLGDAESAQQHIDNIVRPFLDQANRQADETLDSVQAVLAGVLAQLGELQGSVDQRRQALRRCKSDSDSRLSSAFGDWLGQTREPSPPRDRYFFR